MNNYKCRYLKVNNDRNSPNFGFLVEKTKKFNYLKDAVKFSKEISSTYLNYVNRPIIEPIEQITQRSNEIHGERLEVSSG